MMQICGQKCTGCSACYNICPKKAIEMIRVEEGFLYPVIIEEKCIHCNLCRNTCPVLMTKQKEALNQCFAIFSKNVSDLQNSSSGGVFPIISKEVLKQSGIVYGVKFDDHFKNLTYTRVSSLENIESIFGSKYIQSDLANTFSLVKKDLEENRVVLFVGVPCQIAGLKSFLKKDYEKLITCDLFCHGVPSITLFLKYKKYLEDITGKMIEFSFRNKDEGWKNYSISVKSENKTFLENHKSNSYMNLYLSDYGLRKSCYNCHFKLGNKYSDITLGDFWGIENVSKSFYNENGVSAVIVNTIKGQKIMNSIRNEIQCESCSLNDMKQGNFSLFTSALYHRKRKMFYKDLEIMNWEDFQRKYKLQNSFIYKLQKRIKIKYYKDWKK